MTTLLRRILSLLALAMLGLKMMGASAALACVICIPYPKATHADALLASETVVLAREDPAKPYSLAVIEVLKGSVDEESTGIFLPSQTRRKLTLNPTDGVVLVRREATSNWKWVGYATPAYQAFVREILTNAADWRGVRGEQSRFAFYAKHLNDADLRVREQAFLEVGRAPYDWIKGVASSVPIEHVRAVLTNWRFVEWHGLYILMLGQSKEEVDRAYIAKNFERAARFSLATNLSAWTTAYVETHPTVAIERIEERYFKNEERKRGELEEILRALSVLAQADDPILRRRKAGLRWRISRAYASLLEYHPNMAGWVARDLVRWQRKALVDRLTELRRDEATLDPASALAVDIYLSQALRFSSLTPSN